MAYICGICSFSLVVRFNISRLLTTVRSAGDHLRARAPPCGVRAVADGAEANLFGGAWMAFLPCVSAHNTPLPFFSGFTLCPPHTPYFRLFYRQIFATGPLEERVAEVPPGYGRSSAFRSPGHYSFL